MASDKELKQRLMRMAREVDGLNWADRKAIGEAIAIIDAHSALASHTGEAEPEGTCQEDDGCPTEKAVLQRFWRANRATPPAATPAAPGEVTNQRNLAFNLYASTLPQATEHSTSYGGQWSSPWCVVIGGNADVSCKRFTVSRSEKEMLDRGERPYSNWHKPGLPPEYIAWAYCSDVLAALSNPAPVAAPAIPEGMALVPLKMNREMQRVTEQEGWQWREVLAAAGTVEEELCAQADDAAPAPASEAAANPVADAMNDRRPLHEKIAEVRRRERPSAAILTTIVGAAGDSVDAPVQQAGVDDLREGLGQIAVAVKDNPVMLKCCRLIDEHLALAALKGEQPAQPSGSERGEV